MHYLLGYGSLIVGIATILTGLPEVEPEASPAVVGLYIAWTALLVLVFFILAVSQPDFVCCTPAVSWSACTLSRSCLLVHFLMIAR